ncbi:MAG TPA: hypothetical protein V6C99_04815 [Oculatellaceae cyanobacterium]|jgi:hypothetical protein
MTYREMAFGDELKMPAPKDERSALQVVLANQSPVIKFWFVIMALNLLMFLFIIH